MSDIQSKSVLVTCIDTATGTPVERWISIPFPGRSYEDLSAVLPGWQVLASRPIGGAP